MATKRQRFRPPSVTDPTDPAQVAAALRRVYDDLNAVAAMVGGDATQATRGRDTAGQQRVEKRGDTYYLAVRTSEGDRFITLDTERID